MKGKKTPAPQKAPPPSPLEREQLNAARRMWTQHQQTYKPIENRLMQEIGAIDSAARRQENVDQAMATVTQQAQPVQGGNVLGGVLNRLQTAGRAGGESAAGAYVEPRNIALRGGIDITRMGRGVQGMGHETLASSAAREASERLQQMQLAQEAEQIRQQGRESRMNMFGAMTGTALGMAAANPEWFQRAGSFIRNAGSAAPQRTAMASSAPSYTPAKTYGYDNAPRAESLRWSRY